MDFVTGELIFTLALITLAAVVLVAAWSFARTRKRQRADHHDDHALERRAEADAATERRRTVQVEEPRRTPTTGTSATGTTPPPRP